MRCDGRFPLFLLLIIATNYQPSHAFLGVIVAAVNAAVKIGTMAYDIAQTALKRKRMEEERKRRAEREQKMREEDAKREAEEAAEEARLRDAEEDEASNDVADEGSDWEYEGAPFICKTTKEKKSKKKKKGKDKRKNAKSDGKSERKGDNKKQKAIGLLSKAAKMALNQKTKANQKGPSQSQHGNVNIRIYGGCTGKWKVKGHAKEYEGNYNEPISRPEQGILNPKHISNTSSQQWKLVGVS